MVRSVGGELDSTALLRAENFIHARCCANRRTMFSRIFSNEEDSLENRLSTFLGSMCVSVLIFNCSLVIAVWEESMPG